MSYKKAAEYLKSKIKAVPKTAVVLGTGLGDIAESLSDKTIIPYSEIPGFPNTDGTWHKCRAVIGKINDTDVIFMQGRLHYYEGFSMQEAVFPIRMLHAMSVKNIVLTNASGAVNEAFEPGDVVLIDDHIKLGMDSPVRGRNDESLGERFFDMCSAYEPCFKEIAIKAADELGIKLHRGVYGYMTGPQFETPAEIRMLKIIGADLVGMSTVPEVIAGVHCGLRILGLSGVTNMAAGIEGGGMNNSVMEDAETVLKSKIKKLVFEIVPKLNTVNA